MATSDWSARITAATIKDFPALVRELVSEPSSTARDRALGELLSRWIATNPQAFRAFLDQIALDDDDKFADQFFAALPSALSYLNDRAASSPYLQELVAQLIERKAEADPKLALKWAEGWLLGDSLDQARVTIVGELAKNSTEEAMKVVEKIQNPLRHVEALSALGESFAERDPKGALKWAGELPQDTEIAMAMNSVLSVVAENDPEGAAATFRTIQAQIAGRYAGLVAADRKRHGLPEKPVLDASGNEIINDAGAEDLMPWEDPDFNLLADASTTIAHGLGEEDPQQALQWAATLPGVLQAATRRAALSAWAESEPEAAYQYCVTNGWNDAETYGAVFSSWADADPQKAAQAALQVASPTSRKNALSSVVSSWVDQDREGAVQWIAQLPTVKDRNVANQAFAEAMDDNHPKEAWNAATQISTPDERRTVLTSVFSSWIAAEPDAARQALAQASNLTAAERGNLTRMLQGQAVVKKN